MLQKIIRFGVIGGVILFVWGILVWTIFPWQKNQVKMFANEKNVASVIKGNATESGLYVLPDLKGYSEDDLDKAKERMRKGPFIIAMVSLSGRSPGMIGAMFKTLILKIIAASFVAWLLIQAKAKSNRAIKFVTVIGFVIALSTSLPPVIWLGVPVLFGLPCLIEGTIGWFFVALAMAKMATSRND